MYNIGDRVVWNGYHARIWSVEDRRRNGGTVTYGIIYGGDGSTWVQESDISLLA
jgi:hypothetical protein